MQAILNTIDFQNPLILSIIALVAVTLLFGGILAYLAKKYEKSERQINQILSLQGNMDILQGDLQRNTLRTKGRMVNRHTDRHGNGRIHYDELSEIFEFDTKARYQAILAEIVEHDLPYLSFVHRIKHGIQVQYVREYVHLVTPQQFISFLIDKSEEYIQVNQLSHQADTDVLTGLSNRRSLNRVQEKEVISLFLGNHASESSQHYLLLLDIDDFKKINDSYGHVIGDAVLKEFSRRLKEFFTPDTFIMRYGGDEFITVIHADSREEVEKEIANLSKALGNLTLLFEKLDIIISASIGACEFFEDSTFQDIMRAVDKALYEAKEQGKNRVVFADEY